MPGASGLPEPGKSISCAHRRRTYSPGPPGPILPSQHNGGGVGADQGDLGLSQFMKQPLRFETLILDGLGYWNHRPEEVNTLILLLADRYERGSVPIFCHLAFLEY